MFLKALQLKAILLRLGLDIGSVDLIETLRSKVPLELRFILMRSENVTITD